MSETDFDKGTLVIMVTYNSSRDLTDNLDCLRLIAGEPEFDLLMVDNGSADETVSICATIDGAVVESSAVNIGFAAGVNRGLRHIEGHQYFVLLNPDVRITVEGLKDLVSIMDANPGAAVCIPAQVSESAEPTGCWAQGTGLAAMLVADSTLGLYKRIGFLRRRYGWLDVRDLRPGVEPGYVSGACFLGRAAALDEVGRFDKRFFLYYEEADWCRRARAAGWALLVAEGVRATHRLYASSSSEGRARAMYYVSRYKFVRKHYGAAGACLIRAADFASGVLMWLAASVANKIVRSASLDRARIEGSVRFRSAIAGDSAVEGTRP